MKAFGFTLVTAGFLSGAFLASLDANHVNWSLFVPATIAGFAGVWQIRRATRARARSADVLTTNRVNIEESLSRIVRDLDGLDQRKATLPLNGLRNEIDKLRDDLDRFVDARQSLVHLYGLQKYADIMNAFAAGERYTNRVWTAAADGYAEEALSYVERARDQFREARRKHAEAQA